MTETRFQRLVNIVKTLKTNIKSNLRPFYITHKEDYTYC